MLLQRRPSADNFGNQLWGAECATALLMAAFKHSCVLSVTGNCSFVKAHRSSANGSGGMSGSVRIAADCNSRCGLLQPKGHVLYLHDGTIAKKHAAHWTLHAGMPGNA